MMERDPFFLIVQSPSRIVFDKISDSVRQVCTFDVHLTNTFTTGQLLTSFKDLKGTRSDCVICYINADKGC